VGGGGRAIFLSNVGFDLLHRSWSGFPAIHGPEIRASGFPTFVHGMTSVTSKWDLKTAAINEPVMLGPIQVNPGDIVFADETGVVVVPAAKIALALGKAIEIRDAEDSRRARIP
jgi:regulator of RNase E activity RraA